MSNDLYGRGLYVFTGLSTDSNSPTLDDDASTWAAKPLPGQRAYETDTKNVYEFDSLTWLKIRGTDSSGNPAELTVIADIGTAYTQVTPFDAATAGSELPSFLLINAVADVQQVVGARVFVAGQNPPSDINIATALSNGYDDIKTLRVESDYILRLDEDITALHVQTEAYRDANKTIVTVSDVEIFYIQESGVRALDINISRVCIDSAESPAKDRALMTVSGRT